MGMTTRSQWGTDSAAMGLEEGMFTALEVGREAARLAPEADAPLARGVSQPSKKAILRKPALSGVEG